MKPRKRKVNKIFVIAMAASIVFGLTTMTYAATDVFAAATTFINDFKGFFIGVSTACLVVALGIAHFMKTFSSGNPQKIETANHLAKGAIIGWVLVNGTTLLTSTISTYIN